MKTLKKIILILVVLALLALAGGYAAFRIMLPPEKIKELAVNYAKENFGREISFDSASFRIIGISLNNFAVSEASTFKDGTFAKADNLVLKVSVLPLLKKEVMVNKLIINGFEINVIKNKDGSFNFDDILKRFESAPEDSSSGQPQEEDSSSGMSIAVEDLSVKNARVSYADKKDYMNAEIKDFNLSVRDFSFEHAFLIDTDFTVVYKDSSMSAEVPVALKAMADIKNMDLDKAELNIKSLTAKLNGAEFSANGDVANFNNPAVNVGGSLKGFSDKALKGIVSDLPEFGLPAVNYSATLSANLEKSTAKLNSIKANTPKMSFDLSGSAGWAKDVTYDIKANFNADVSEVNDIIPAMLKEFAVSGVAGRVKGSADVTPKTLKGKINLSDLGVSYGGAVDVAAVNGDVELLSYTGIKTGSVTGKINGQDFKTDLSFSEVTKNLYSLVFNFNMDKFIMKNLPDTGAPSAQASAAQTPAKTASATAAKGPYFNVKANVNINSIEVPHFVSEGVALAVDLSRMDMNFDQASGLVTFDLNKSTITDLQSFLESNKIVNSLFFVVKIINKTAGVLKLDILTPSEDKADQPKGIQIAYMKGVYSLLNGVVTLKENTIDTDLTMIKADGTADLKTEKLNMKVYSHVGRQSSSGFKPVVFKVSGTLSDPKASLDLVSTATSIIPGATGVATGTVKDAASGTVNTAKDAVKGIVGLFKKDDKEEK